MSEPAIQVRRKGKGTQVWTIEKLENKLVDMRDHYRDWKEGAEAMVENRIKAKTEKMKQIKRDIQPFSLLLLFFLIKYKANSNSCDPFYEAQENHNLIGVANIFLECLFHDVKLQYAVPIISQQGEVTRLTQPAGLTAAPPFSQSNSGDIAEKVVCI